LIAIAVAIIFDVHKHVPDWWEVKFDFHYVVQAFLNAQGML